MATVSELAARALRKLRIVSIAQASTAALPGNVVSVTLIAKRALQNLVVIDAEEAALAADQTLAEEKVTSVHEMLLAQNKVPWASTAIPRGAAEPYAVMAAFMLARAFGTMGITGPSAEEYDLALANLTGFVELGPRAQGIAEEKIKQVHFELGARAKVRWTLFDIPNYVEEAYIMMACFYLGPEFDKQVPYDWYVTGERTVLKSISLPPDEGPTVAVYF